MMMRMIDAGGIPALIDNVRQADEDNPKGYWEFEPVKRTREDASWLEQANGKVVKMVHLLLKDLPDNYQYRVLFMRRRLEEVVASQATMLERNRKEGGSLSEEQLIRIFGAQIKEIDEYVQQHANMQMIHVNYNEIINDPQPWAEKINAFLGNSLDTNAMAAIVDPSLYRQRR
jgi:hypothetical protein